MILVDTSVWVRYFRPSADARFREKVLEFLGRKEVVVSPVVRFEIAGGAKSDVEFQKYERWFEALKSLDISEEIWKESEHQQYRLVRAGVTVPMADLLIAVAAFEGRHAVFHHDRHFKVLAHYMPLATISWDEKTKQFLRRDPGSPPRFQVAEREAGYGRSRKRGSR